MPLQNPQNQSICATENNFSVSILPLQNLRNKSFCGGKKIISAFQSCRYKNSQNYQSACCNKKNSFFLPLQNPQNQSVYATENIFRVSILSLQNSLN